MLLTSKRRKGGRVVECAGLENRYGCKPIEGSNPSLSAKFVRSDRLRRESRQRGWQWLPYGNSCLWQAGASPCTPLICLDSYRVQGETLLAEGMNRRQPIYQRFALAPLHPINHRITNGSGMGSSLVRSQTDFTFV